MPKLSIGEAEELLRLPASTIRHWERVLAVVSPDKDVFGRRRYGEAELRLLFRIRHLSQREGLGLKEAQERILAEISKPLTEERALLAELRGDFVGLWTASRDASRTLESVAPRKRGAGKD